MLKQVALALTAMLVSTGIVVAGDASRLLPAKPKVLDTGPGDLSTAVPTSTGFLVGSLVGPGSGVPGDKTFFLRSFSPKGEPLKPIANAVSARGPVTVTRLSGDRFAVIWQKYTGFIIDSSTRGGIFDLKTNKLTGIRSFGPPSPYGHVAARLSNDRIALLTYDYPTERTKVMLTILDDSLNKLSGPTSLNGDGYDSARNETADFALVKSGAGGFAIWRNRLSGRLLMRRFSLDGIVDSRTIKIDKTRPSPPTSPVEFEVKAIELTDRRILVTWAFQSRPEKDFKYKVWARLFTPGGEPIGNDFRVSAVKNLDQYRPEPVALPDGAFAIGYVSGPIGMSGQTQHLIRAFRQDGTPAAEPIVTHTIPHADWTDNDTSLVRLKDGSLLHAFSDDGSIQGYGIPKRRLVETD